MEECAGIMTDDIQQGASGSGIKEATYIVKTAF